MKKSSVGEPSLRDVLLAVNDLSTNMDQRFNAVDKRFEGMDQRFNKIDERFERNELELFSIRANMATKQDIVELTLRMDTMQDEVMKSVDGFGVLCQKFDVGLLALRSRFVRMESFMRKVADRLSMQGEMI